MYRKRPVSKGTVQSMEAGQIGPIGVNVHRAAEKEPAKVRLETPSHTEFVPSTAPIPGPHSGARNVPGRSG